MQKRASISANTLAQRMSKESNKQRAKEFDCLRVQVYYGLVIIFEIRSYVEAIVSDNQRVSINSSETNLWRLREAT